MILPFQLSAQIEWEEMQPHNAASIIPILVTDDDRIYGKLEHSNKLFYSEDMAETWTLLYEGEFMDQRFPKGSLKVLKDDMIEAFGYYTDQIYINLMIPLWISNYKLMLQRGNGF